MGKARTILEMIFQKRSLAVLLGMRAADQKSWLQGGGCAWWCWSWSAG